MSAWWNMDCREEYETPYEKYRDDLKESATHPVFVFFVVLAILIFGGALAWHITSPFWSQLDAQGKVIHRKIETIRLAEINE